MVFFLRAKSDAAEDIIAFIKKMEVLNDKKIRALRSDNGTEFKNSTLESYCTERGISQNFSAARTPEQNGVAERKNRTLIEAARTMLLEANLPKQFWAEAVNTACFTQNRSIYVKKNNKTAYEALRGRKPYIGFFHVFGCVCFILNNRDQLSKFDAKADKGIFVGYSRVSKAYRVFNKRRQTIEESIHVTFEEHSKALNPPADGASAKFDLVENTSPTDDLFVDATADDVEEDSSLFFDAREDALNDDQSNERINMLRFAGSSFPKNPSLIQEESNTISAPALSTLIENQATEVTVPAVDPITAEVNEELASPAENITRSCGPSTKWTIDHPIELVIGDPQQGVTTRSKATPNLCCYVNFLSDEEPKKVQEALKDPNWIQAM